MRNVRHARRAWGTHCHAKKSFALKWKVKRARKTKSWNMNHESGNRFSLYIWFEFCTATVDTNWILQNIAIEFWRNFVGDLQPIDIILSTIRRTSSQFHSASFFWKNPFKPGTKEFYSWLIRVSTSWYCEKHVFEWHCRYCVVNITIRRCHIFGVLYAFFCAVRPFTNIIR